MSRDLKLLLALLATRKRTYALGMIALAVAAIPMIVFYFTIITAPVALFLVLRNWNRVKTPVPRTKIRFVAAAALATLQLCGWLALIILIALNI